jgi:AraC-like DNA-binding protein
VKRGQDIAVTFPGLYLVHHNLPGKRVAVHHHPEHLVFFPLQGEIRVTLSDRTLTAGPGAVIYLPPRTDHAFDSSSQLGERLICLVPDRRWKRAAKPPGEPLVFPASQLAKELLFYLLLHPETRHAGSLIETFLQTLGESAEAGTPLMAHAESRVRDPRVRRVLDSFQSDLAEPLSIPEVAAKAGLSVRTLNRLFAVELGATPKQILNRYRISAATELLVSGRANVTEAAFHVGYQSLAQFIRVFRQLTGQLPSEVARMGRSRAKLNL